MNDDQLLDEALQRVLMEQEFTPIAKLQCHLLPSTLWWHDKHKMELQVSHLTPSQLVVKGIKRVFLRAISEEGKETLNRDLSKAMEFLESISPELNVYASIQPRVTESLIPGFKEYEEGKERLEELKNSFEIKTEELDELRWPLKYIRGRLAQKALGEDVAAMEQEVRELKHKGEQLLKWLQLKQEYIKAYEKEGRATSIVCGYGSVPRLCMEHNFRETVSHTVKEVMDYYHYQLRQKLSGYLQVYAQPVEIPWLVQIDWTGLFSPIFLEKLGDDYRELREQMEKLFMVTSAQDIKIRGAIVERAKRTPAKWIQILLNKLDVVSKGSLVPTNIPSHGTYFGNIIRDSDITDIPFLLPLDNVDNLAHMYDSGSTGRGKSVTARVIVENALAEGASVIILDPTSTGQWSGLAKPAEDKDFENRFKELGVSPGISRGFEVKIYVPGPEDHVGLDLPEDLGELTRGCSVLSLHHLTDREACELARDILKEIYDSMDVETKRLRLLIVLEEAHKFISEYVDKEARSIALECLRLLKNLSMEARKHGICFLFISQSLKTFKNQGSIVREMINSRFFMRANDEKEIDYVKTCTSDEVAEAVKHLKKGEAIISLSNFDPVKVCVRPPFSQVRGLRDEEIDRAMAHHKRRDAFIAKASRTATSFDHSDEEMGIEERHDLTDDEIQVIDTIKEYIEKNGRSPNKSAIRAITGFGGSRSNRCFESLKRKGIIQEELGKRNARFLKMTGYLKQTVADNSADNTG